MGFFESFRKKPVPKERIEKALNTGAEKEAQQLHAEQIRAFQDAGAGVKEDQVLLERLRPEAKEKEE